MIRDGQGDRVIYRFEDSRESNYFVISRGDRSLKTFRQDFNLTVEQFCDVAQTRMEYLPVDGGFHHALNIIEKQPWAEAILP